MWLTLQPWRWERHVPSNHHLASTILNNTISQKTEFLQKSTIYLLIIIPYWNITENKCHPICTKLWQSEQLNSFHLYRKHLTCILLVANSTPIVDFDSKLNSLRVKRDNKLLFPTPESPMSTTANIKITYVTPKFLVTSQ